MKYVLSVVFNREETVVLMCMHSVLNAMVFVGSKVEQYELEMSASYRELEEEAGITNEDIELHFVRRDEVNSVLLGKFSLYVTTGRLLRDVDLVAEKNQLFWISVDNTSVFLNAYGYVSCYMYLKESWSLLHRGAV